MNLLRFLFPRKPRPSIEQLEYNYLKSKLTRTPKDFARIAELEKQLRK